MLGVFLLMGLTRPASPCCREPAPRLRGLTMSGSPAPSPSHDTNGLPVLVSADPAHASDADLARALLAGHPGAHRAAWERFYPMVSGMIRRAYGGGSDAEDLVQEVFLCLFRRIQTLRNPAALRAFTMAIASRTLSFELRKRRARLLSTATDVDAGEAADELLAGGHPEARRAVATLTQLLERLRTRDRTAFVLRYIEKRNAVEVADALGVSVPTATRSFSRAWKRIHLWASRDPTLVEYLRHQ